MNPKIFGLIFILWSIGTRETAGRRIGPSGSIFSKPKGPSQSVFGSRPSSGAAIYAKPVYGRNYGGFSGRQSSSGNGFGFGLGSGLLVGYGIGMLSRPAGFGTPGYGYNYYHRGRTPLKDSERLECVVANYTLYTKAGSADSNIGIDESSKKCDTHENICYGKLTVTTVNLTTYGNETVLAIEIQVEKGCDSVDNFSGNRKTIRGDYNPDRKCWDSDVKEVTLKTIASDLGSDYSYEYEDDSNLLSTFSVDLFADDAVRDALHLNGDVRRMQKIRQQSETCICDTHLCNSAGGPWFDALLFFTISLLLHSSSYFLIFSKI